MDKPRTMTAMQKKFCAEYIADFNKTQAAIRAGYSEKTAYSAGSRLLKNVEVRKEVERLQQEQLDAASATALEITEFLTRIMRGEENEDVLVRQKTGVMHVEKRPDVKDRIRAAELLGKRLGIFNETVELAPANSAVREEVAAFLRDRLQAGGDEP